MDSSVRLHDIKDYPAFILGDCIEIFDRSWMSFLDDNPEVGPCGPRHLWATDADEAFQCAVKLRKTHSESLRYLAIGLETRVATFRLCMHPGEQVEYCVDGKKYIKEGEVTSSYVDQGVWLDAYYSALILRNNEAIRELSMVPEAVIKNSYFRLDDFSLAEFNLLQGLFNASANFQSLFESLANAIKPEEVTAEREGIFFDILVPTAMMIGHIFGRSETGYQDAMSEALQQHWNYYSSSDDHIRAKGGWTSLRLTAMAVLAYEHKGYLPAYKSDLEREYVPEWLVKGDFT
ncbi:immunity 49 family protein [Endozoicomonas arenosclerae]|uniref:immunity 49 family protein n=1 Tax=Endozoicomonas arenosclerae TaxID=1633495 RepID=UPI000784E6D9|nr:immunity 49 family protein [Endozoicomonas arenosclerae]